VMARADRIGTGDTKKNAADDAFILHKFLDSSET
jgi:hypothetical protein